jgi:hypothetical protein
MNKRAIKIVNAASTAHLVLQLVSVQTCLKNARQKICVMSLVHLFKAHIFAKFVTEK